MKKRVKQKTLQFDVTVNGETISVVATPYIAVDKQRFRVSCNEGPVYVFGVDENTEDVKLLESPDFTMSPELLNAVSQELTMQLSKMAA